MADTGRLGNTYLELWDVVVIVGYFLAVLAVGIWSSLKNRGSVGGFFLAGRNMHWIPVGASLFASNIGSGHFIGLAGSAAGKGIGVAFFELNAIFVLLILGWIFVPVYTAAGVYTMPEYLKKRFGGCRIRIYLSFLALFLYIFTKISADLYAGALFIEQAVKFDIYVAIVILLAIAALFSITGGLTAVIWTDFAQTIIMIIGALILMIMSFNSVGGYKQLVDKYAYAIPEAVAYSNNTQCGLPKKDYMNLVRSASDDSYPWPGMFFGLTISSIWYWCSDQVIVQRALAAKNLSHAKGGIILAGYLKFLPMFLLVFPGMAARILYTDKVGCVDPKVCEAFCGSPQGCTNVAYSELVLDLMPEGLRGLMLAVMMAALMSSLTSIFNSSSTLFTMDIWKRFRRNAREVELMIVGRVFVLFLVGCSIAWVPVIQQSQGTNLFDYIQQITSYLAPPVCAVYVLAVFVKRVNETGAFWGLMVGMVIGMIRFGWGISYPVAVCGEDDPTPEIIKSMHYLHFGILLFGITCVVIMVISLLTPPIPDRYLHRLTFFDRFNKLVAEPIPETVGISSGNACCCSQEDSDTEEANTAAKGNKKYGYRERPASQPGADNAGFAGTTADVSASSRAVEDPESAPGSVIWTVGGAKGALETSMASMPARSSSKQPGCYSHFPVITLTLCTNPVPLAAGSLVVVVVVGTNPCCSACMRDVEGGMQWAGISPAYVHVHVGHGPVTDPR